MCEAQLVGCPVVSTNVGGISSLIEDGIDGFLIPSNDPYMMAWKLLNLYKDKQLNQIVASKGQERAKVRHNKERVVKELIDIYDKILSNNNDTNNKRPQRISSSRWAILPNSIGGGNCCTKFKTF